MTPTSRIDHTTNTIKDAPESTTIDKRRLTRLIHPSKAGRHHKPAVCHDCISRQWCADYEKRKKQCGRCIKERVKPLHQLSCDYTEEIA